MSYNIIDIILVAITVFILTYSFFKGFIKRMSWSLATAGSLVLSAIACKYLINYLKFAQNSTNVVLFAVTFVVLLILLKIILNFISKKLKDKAILGTLDKLLGLAVGILQSGAILALAGILAFYLLKDYSADSIIVKTIANFLNLKG